MPSCNPSHRRSSGRSGDSGDSELFNQTFTKALARRKVPIKYVQTGVTKEDISTNDNSTGGCLWRGLLEQEGIVCQHESWPALLSRRLLREFVGARQALEDSSTRMDES